MSVQTQFVTSSIYHTKYFNSLPQTFGDGDEAEIERFSVMLAGLKNYPENNKKRHSATFESSEEESREGDVSNDEPIKKRKRISSKRSSSPIVGSPIPSSPVSSSFPITPATTTGNNRLPTSPSRPTSPHQSKESANASSNPAVALTHEERWMERFNELKGYREQFGNCNITFAKEHESFKQLAYWVSNQRISYRKRNMPEHRRKLLLDIGFDFGTSSSGSTNDEDANTQKKKNVTSNTTSPALSVSESDRYAYGFPRMSSSLSSSPLMSSTDNAEFDLSAASCRRKLMLAHEQE